MAIHDVSVGISPDLPVWPGEPPVELERISRISQGAQANVSRLSCGVHIGTHVDAPIHYIEGRGGIEEISLQTLIGEAQVVDLTRAEILDAETLRRARLPSGTERALLKTRNSDLWAEAHRRFHTDFVAIDAGGAQWLAAAGVRLVGVDYLSVGPYRNNQPAHRILLGQDIVLVEGLDLAHIAPGRYKLYCLPIKLVGSDGAPARAILEDI